MSYVCIWVPIWDIFKNLNAWHVSHIHAKYELFRYDQTKTHILAIRTWHIDTFTCLIKLHNASQHTYNSRSCPYHVYA